MKILRYIIAGFFAICGLNWMFNPKVESITYGIEGLFILATAIFIAPFMSKILKKSVRLSGAIGSFVVLSGLIYFNMNDQEEKNSLKNAEADKLFAQINPVLEVGNIDSAASIANKAKDMYSNVNNNPASDFLKEYEDFNDSKFFESKLISISDAAFDSIKQGLPVIIFKNETLNNLFAKKLIEKEENRATILADLKRQREHEERQALIKKQFSGWDGSHRGLEKLIKESMNDPDSYEHVETRFGDQGDHLLVSCKFRGKNAFNATVTNSVTAKVDFNGNVLQIVEQSW